MELSGELNSLLLSEKANLVNETEVLKSKRLLRRVALTLDLTTTYYFDEKISSSELWVNCPFKVIWLNPQDSIHPKKIKFSIELEKEGYKIISKDKFSNEIFQFGQKNKVSEHSFILSLTDKVVPEKRDKKQFTINRTPLSFVLEELSILLK